MAENKDKRTVEIIVNGQQANASLKEMNAAAAVLYNQFSKLSADDPGRAKLIADYQALKGRIADVKTELTGVSQNAGIMKQAMANAFAFVIGGSIEAAIGKVFSLGKSIFDTSAKFETYSAVMTNALGSSSLAQKALKDIQTMAAQTPFSVDELTGSFIKFVNRGLQPSMAEMTKMADIAASQGKSFDQLTEAVLDAAGGEFERLKEFGIKASKSGDQVELSFKGVQKTVANTPEAINAAILAFGEMKGIMGSTAAISETMEGQLSNLGDTADQVAIEFGQRLRPVFVAILSTLGFFLGVLRELPRFLVENRGLLLGLGVAVLTLNGASIAATASTLAYLAVEKARAIATRATAAAQWLLNAAMTANPIGLVVAAVALLVGGFVTLYEKSEVVRATISGLGAVFKQVFVNIAKAAVEHLAGLGDIIVGVATFDIGKIQSGGQKLINSFKMLGAGVGDAYTKGYDGKLAEEKAARDKKAQDEAAESGRKQGDAGGKARAAAEAKARMEALKNEEAALKERLAKAKEDSELEMRLKQQLVTNNAKQELEDEKKTATDRRIVLAEAEQKRVDLAQAFYEKQGKARKDTREKAAAEAEKERKANELAERHHQEMLLNLEEAALIARGNKRETELKQILLDARRKALAVTGTEAEKQAAVALLMTEAHQKQLALQAKFDEEDRKQQEEFIGHQLDDIEEDESRKQAAFSVMFEAGLLSQQGYEDARYEARKAALEQELILIESTLGKQRQEYKRAAADILKNEVDHNKASVANAKQAQKAKDDIAKLGLRVSSDVLQTTIDLLFEDGEARKKHHGLYLALAGAKVIAEGIAEVQAIWSTYSEMGPLGVVLAAVQTGISVARSAMAINKLNATGTVAGYAKGGATGTGANMAVSPMGVLLEMSGLAVGTNGKLLDNSGFAVAGVVHEDEYVVPKWMRADPQVAAVEQWLEARRLRGYFEGGATGGAALPAASAAPQSDGELMYAVMVQLLEQSRRQTEQLADVREWKDRLTVALHLGELDDTLSERKQVQLENGIRA